MIADFFTALWSMSESPLVRFLAVALVGYGLVKAWRWFTAYLASLPAPDTYWMGDQEISRREYELLRKRER